MSPCQKVQDIQYENTCWRPKFWLIGNLVTKQLRRKNLPKNGLTLKEALKQSRNSISVWIVKELGSVKLIRKPR